jgi:hypothetical protein
MHLNQREKIIRKLLSLPPTEWPSAVLRIQRRHKLTASDMGELTRSLDDECERCAFLSEYISTRFGTYGDGEKLVAAAVDAARKHQAKVIKALGYNTTYRHPFFSSEPNPQE